MACSPGMVWSSLPRTKGGRTLTTCGLAETETRGVPPGDVGGGGGGGGGKAHAGAHTTAPQIVQGHRWVQKIPQKLDTKM